jgi:hypothetical protein
MLATATALALLSSLACESTPVDPVEGLPTESEGLEPAAKKQLDPDLCALDRPGFTLESENDFFPLGVGSWWFLRGKEDGELIEVRIRVLNQTEDVGGVTTRVVQEREWVDGELLEVSRNFFAEASDETVCYFGEEVDIYEDGEIVSHDGAWRADDPGNRPGIIMPANPRRGMTFQMEGAPGVAEDVGEVVRRGWITVWIQESSPLEGGAGDIKGFAEDIGLIVDGPISLRRWNVVDDD